MAELQVAELQAVELQRVEVQIAEIRAVEITLAVDRILAEPQVDLVRQVPQHQEVHQILLAPPRVEHRFPQLKLLKQIQQRQPRLETL